jgi:hypothetical protein
MEHRNVIEHFFNLLVLYFLPFVFFLILKYLWWNLQGNEFSCNSRSSVWCFGISLCGTKSGTHKRWEVPGSSFILPTYQFNSPLFEIYGSPCDRESEAKESALIHALAYISEVLDFKIGDFNYMDYLFKKNGGSVWNMCCAWMYLMLRLKYWCTF